MGRLCQRRECPVAGGFAVSDKVGYA